MAIKKRSKTRAKSTVEKLYHDFRRGYWESQPKDVNFHSSKMADGSKITQPILNPKKNLFLKDVWHCPSPDSARELVGLLAQFKDIHYLEFKYSWVWVEWTHNHDHVLPGQETDDRENVKG